MLWFEFYLCGYLHWQDREDIFESIQSVIDYLPLGCWLFISSGDGLHLWLLGALVYLTLLGKTLLKIVEVQTEYQYYFTGKYDHAKISTKPVMSSNKSSTFTAKHKSDNEETTF